MGKPNQDYFEYYLVESVLQVTASVKEAWGDSNDIPIYREVSDLSIDVLHRADLGDPHRIALSGSNTKWNLAARTNGTLESASNSATAAGPLVVSVISNILRIAGSVALSVAKGAIAGGPGVAASDTSSKQVMELLSTAEKLAILQRQKLQEIRALMVEHAPSAICGSDEDDESRVRRYDLAELSKAERVLVRGLRGTTAEIERLKAILHLETDLAHQAAASLIEIYVPIGEVKKVRPGQEEEPPVPAQTDPDVLESDFGIFVRCVDYRRELNPHRPSDDSSFIEWRDPRRIELIFWKQVADGKLRMVKRQSILVVDNYCTSRFLEFEQSGWWSTEDANIAFNELGAPQSMGLNRSGVLSNSAVAISGAAPMLIEAAGGVGTVLDARRAKRKSAAQLAQAELDAQVNLEKNRLELLGLNATAERFAELRRLEQEAAITKARAAVDATES